MLFRLCFEKDVWLLVSCFILALLEAAAAVKNGDQNWISSRIPEGTFRPPGNLLLRLILRHFRYEKLGGVLLLRLCFEKSVWLLVSCFIRGSSSSNENWRSNWTKLDFQ